MKNTVTIKVSGKNIERFIHRLSSKKIEILDLKYIKNNEIIIKVYLKDYNNIMEIKSIYEVSIVESHGLNKLKRDFKKNRVLIFFLILGIIFLYFLSNIIFKVEVIHNDSDIRELLLKELEVRGIYEKSFKKSFKELEKIKIEILEKYKDKLEWVEIENIGTKYIVRVEERKKQEIKETALNRHVVAKKSAIIKKIEALSGEVLKNINDYVNEGEIVISGEIKLNDEIKNMTSASGKIFGEVWYQTKIEFPYLYKEEFRTGKSKTLYTIKFLNYSFSLFDFKPYKNKVSEEKVIFKNNLIPLKFVKEKVWEVRVKEQIYTEEEAIKEASLLGIKKMEEKLKKDERIIDQKNLKVEVKESKIEVEMFFTVYEDITSYKLIEVKGE